MPGTWIGSKSGRRSERHCDPGHYGVDAIRVRRHAPIVALTILSGSLTGSPRLILSTFSMPSVTLPQTVYWLSRKRASSKQMKNWLSPESGLWARAIETVPRTCGSLIELGLELLAGPAGAGALRASRLRHEAVDDAVKDDAVVEAVAHQLLDARDMTGREVGPHFDHDIALGGLQSQRIFRLGHLNLLSTSPNSNREAVHPPDRALQRSIVAFLM